MKYFCSIRISTVNENYQKISKILDVEISDYKKGWIYEVVLIDDGDYYSVINMFLDKLNKHIKELKSLGISSENISIWLIYEYSEQCDLEFEPTLLKRLGQSEIHLCISCYEA